MFYIAKSIPPVLGRRQSQNTLQPHRPLTHLQDSHRPDRLLVLELELQDLPRAPVLL